MLETKRQLSFRVDSLPLCESYREMTHEDFNSQLSTQKGLKRPKGLKRLKGQKRLKGCKRQYQ
jgi:hypothetical protein